MINIILSITGILGLFIILIFAIYRINNKLKDLSDDINELDEELTTSIKNVRDDFDKKIACQNFKIRRLDTQSNKSSASKDIRKAINNKK